VTDASRESDAFALRLREEVPRLVRLATRLLRNPDTVVESRIADAIRRRLTSGPAGSP
jgi:hypothetical protein